MKNRTRPLQVAPTAFYVGAVLLSLLLVVLLSACAGVAPTATIAPTATPGSGTPMVSGPRTFAALQLAGYKADRDLTAAFPHPENLLATVPVVGTYVG
jgi:hypothetical protein